MKTDVLYYGDNLEILRKYVPDASVDLVYLDPPFNSNRDYNVIFKDESGRKSDAQLLAFEDTWHWGPDAEAQYAYLTNTSRNEGRVPSTVSTIVAALRSGIGENQMMAYLVEMAVRLVELHPNQSHQRRHPDRTRGPRCHPSGHRSHPTPATERLHPAASGRGRSLSTRLLQPSSATAASVGATLRRLHAEAQTAARRRQREQQRLFVHEHPAERSAMGVHLN